MLHDLYLLSCFFEPSQAVLYEEDLERRYGVAMVKEALLKGWIELYSRPSLKEPSAVLCRLSKTGIGKIESMQS
jgi:hypothetical protein